MDCFSKPFIENASNGLLNYLFQDEGGSADIPIYDPYQASTLSFDSHDGDFFTDTSSVSTQRTGDFFPPTCILFGCIFICRHPNVYLWNELQKRAGQYTVIVFPSLHSLACPSRIWTSRGPAPFLQILPTRLMPPLPYLKIWVRSAFLPWILSLPKSLLP